MAPVLDEKSGPFLFPKKTFRVDELTKEEDAKDVEVSDLSFKEFNPDTISKRINRLKNSILVTAVGIASLMKL